MKEMRERERERELVTIESHNRIFTWKERGAMEGERKRKNKGAIKS